MMSSYELLLLRLITCWLASRAFRPKPARWQGASLAEGLQVDSKTLLHVSHVMSFATTQGSHEYAPNIEFSFVGFFVWKDYDSQNQTLTIGRLLQSCMLNYLWQEKLEHSKYICVTFAIFLFWVNPQCFLVHRRVAAHTECDKQMV